MSKKEDNQQNLTNKELYDLNRQEKETVNRQQYRKRSAKRAVFWVMIVVVIGGAIFGVIKLGGTSPSGQSAVLIDAVSPLDWSKGNQEASVVFVEYSDFQCPACRSYYPLLKKLNEEFGGKMKFVYRHFPLSKIHKNAELAARAAEAAGKQGKFWEMHDMIFENQSVWSGKSGGDTRDAFASYAKSLNLDMERFDKDLDSKEIKDKVENDYQSGVRAQVNATPTFFLNGVKLENPKNFDELRSRIEQAVNAGY